MPVINTPRYAGSALHGKPVLMEMRMELAKDALDGTHAPLLFVLGLLAVHHCLLQVQAAFVSPKRAAGCENVQALVCKYLV